MSIILINRVSLINRNPQKQQIGFKGRGKKFNVRKNERTNILFDNLVLSKLDKLTKGKKLVTEQGIFGETILRLGKDDEISFFPLTEVIGIKNPIRGRTKNESILQPEFEYLSLSQDTIHFDLFSKFKEIFDRIITPKSNR